MSGVRTMEDFIRQRMTVDRCKRMTISRRSDGAFEASWVHADGKTATVEVHDDPATALWNSLVPFQMRRRLPSGREVSIEGNVFGIDAKPNTSAERVNKTPIPMHVTDDLDDLLGDTVSTATVDTDDDLEGLLG